MDILRDVFEEANDKNREILLKQISVALNAPMRQKTLDLLENIRMRYSQEIGSSLMQDLMSKINFKMGENEYYIAILDGLLEHFETIRTHKKRKIFMNELQAVLNAPTNEEARGLLKKCALNIILLAARKL